MVVTQEECSIIEFELIKNNNGYIFYKVYINGKCKFDKFEKEIEKDKNMKGDLARIYSIMTLYQDNPPLPPKMFRHLTLGKGQRPDLYEFKSKYLRVYVIKHDKTFYIVRGGMKKDQDKDLKYIKDNLSKIYQQP